MDSVVRWDLLNILREELLLDVEAIDDDTHLVADLGFDSVMYPVAAVAIERQLGIALTTSRLQGCSTFGALVALVEEIERGVRATS